METKTGFTKWEAKRDENGNYGFQSFPDAPFRITSKAEAQLLVATINACQSVNPNNPQAVAESIKDMYCHLKAMCEAAEKMSCWDKMPNDVYYKANDFLKNLDSK